LLKGGFSEFEMMGLSPDESDDIGVGVTLLKKREMARRDLVFQWWRYFYSFYLLYLTRFYLPDPSSVTNLFEGQVVLVSHDNGKRIDWKMAQILEVRKGKDGRT
jgi:hypothetical protein